MFPALWAAAEQHGINPVGMVAQAAKETAWGRYPGKVKPWFYNTAGVKVRHTDDVRRIIAGERFGLPPEEVSADQLREVSVDHPLVHQQNASWEVGADVQARHLREWCGQPAEGLNIDPRAQAVRQLLPTKGPAVTWMDLGTRWAPSPTYGVEIMEIMDRLSVP